MNSQEYWRKREEEWILQQLAQDQDQSKAIAKKLQASLDAIQKEIDANWERFAGREGVTLSEAKKKALKMDVESFARKAKAYVKAKDFSSKANEELRLYNVTMRTNRLELLKSQIGLELIAMSDELDQYMAETLTKSGEEEALRQAGILGETLSKDYRKVAEEIVNASFQGATFSERIWGNSEVLKTELDRLLTKSLVQGRNPREMARELRTLFDRSQYEAERLMRTETARVQISMQMRSYLDAGITEYQFIAEPSACPTCAALNGKIFKVEDFLAGKNAPPMHPHCRCSTVPFMEWDSIEVEQSQRITPKDTNNQYSVNRDIVNTKKYHDKFEKLGLSKNLLESVYGKATEALERRDGTEYEDIFAFDSRTGKLLSQNLHPSEPFKSRLSRTSLNEMKFDTLTILHNHPESGRLSYADLKTMYKNSDIDKSIAVGHDGSVHLVFDMNRSKDLVGYHERWYNYYKSLGYTDRESQLKATDRIYEKGWFKYVKK